MKNHHHEHDRWPRELKARTEPPPHSCVTATVVVVVLDGGAALVMSVIKGNKSRNIICLSGYYPERHKISGCQLIPIKDSGQMNEHTWRAYT